MTYRFAIWRLCFCRTLSLARAAAKASSWNGFGCALIVRPLQVLVRVWTELCGGMACERWNEQGGTCALVARPYSWAFGVIAYNVRL
jgi:hypothetical protein